MMRNSIQVVARVKPASDTGLPCFSTADQSLDIMEQSTAQCLVSLSIGRLTEEVRGTVGSDRQGYLVQERTGSEENTVEE